jgi:hypothetical protein
MRNIDKIYINGQFVTPEGTEIWSYSTQRPRKKSEQ